MRHGSGLLVATEARSGCPGDGSDPARTGLRDEAEQEAEQRSHGRRPEVVVWVCVRSVRMSTERDGKQDVRPRG